MVKSSKVFFSAAALGLIAISAPAQAAGYAEGTDVDIFTAATDPLGQPTRTPFVLEAGANLFEGSINSPSDSSDFIPIEVLAGLKLTGLSIIVNEEFDFSDTQFFFSNLQGGDIIQGALGSFSTDLDLGPNLYGLQFGSGVVKASYQVTFNVTSVGGPTGAVPEPSTWLLMLLGFAAVGFSLRRHKRDLQLRFA